MLKEKSAGQYQTITASLVKDISVLHGRLHSYENFTEEVDKLIRDYARYYSRHNIHLSLSVQDNQFLEPELSFVDNFIHITGSLPLYFEFYVLDYSLDISEYIADMQSIQNILLLSAVTFSVIAAFAIHYMLSFIFTDKLETQISLLEKELAGKQQFVDNFAHEIRTPLTSIYGYAEYLQKALLKEEDIIESAGYIMDEASHMKEIANSLLELSTLRHYVPIKSKVSISSLFNEVKNSLREHEVKIDCHMETEILECQEDLIKVLLLNLCSNAIKADSSKITLKAKKKSGNTIISVADNGCGIPSDSLGKIMEPFYRVDKSRSKNYGGVGLGLTLCRQIVQAHNAEISVGSTVNIGTTVTIIFTTS